MKKDRFRTAGLTITGINRICMRHMVLVCRDAVISAACTADAAFLRFSGKLSVSAFGAGNEETVLINRNAVMEKHQLITSV